MSEPCLCLYLKYHIPIILYDLFYTIIHKIEVPVIYNKYTYEYCPAIKNSL
jgi:hypothetical protein